MLCGLDFGTSNCSLGIFQGGRPVLAAIEKTGPYMPSAVFVRRQDQELSIPESLLQERVASRLRSERGRAAAAKKKGLPYRPVSEAQILREEREALRAALSADSGSDYSNQTMAAALRRGGDVSFGEEALRANAISPTEGFFFKSPKLFLGSSIEHSHLETFGKVIALMLEEVRKRAEAQAGTRLKYVVLGHPVVYSNTRGREGVRQALAVMAQCAASAGFDEAAFLPEPLAAALHYERTVDKEEIILVVDVGGGTTDCAVVRVGPERRHSPNRLEDVLAYAGDRVGGVAMDLHLAWHSVMPLLGRDALLKSGLPVPAPLLKSAISIDDVPAQARFSKSGDEIAALIDKCLDPDRIKRLHALWSRKLQYQLVQDCERAKIALSEQQATKVRLDYLERDLASEISRRDLRSAIDSDVRAVGKVAIEAVTQAKAKVDKVFITGGASRSPIVIEAIQAVIGADAVIVRGNDFGSVTEGLAEHARTLFGSRRKRAQAGE